MKISQSLRKFAADESGVTAIEYGILVAAMAAAVGYIFSSDGAFISALRDKFQQIADDISLKTVESTLSQIRRRRARGTSGLWPSSP